MKGYIKKIKIFGIGLVSVLPMTLCYAKLPPSCPVSADVPLIFASPNIMGGGWGAISAPLGGSWGPVFVNMLDTDINSKTTALRRARKIRATLSGAPVETKVYLNAITNKGKYFYTCSYAIGPSYVETGDDIVIFTSTDGANGTPIAKDYTPQQKAMRFFLGIRP